MYQSSLGEGHIETLENIMYRNSSDFYNDNTYIKTQLIPHSNLEREGKNPRYDRQAKHILQ